MGGVINDYIFGIRRCYGPDIHHGAESLRATYSGVILDWGERAQIDHCINLARVILTEFANTQVADANCEIYAIECVSKFDHDKFNLVRDQIEEWLKGRKK